VEDRAAVLVRSAAFGGDRAGLTESEYEVALLALRGSSNRDIAARRGTSVRTVANQLRSVYRKLRIRSRAGLANSLPFGAGASRNPRQRSGGSS
jgi:DNA-binding CsgD family transcriptional regulator